MGSWTEQPPAGTPLDPEWLAKGLVAFVDGYGERINGIAPILTVDNGATIENVDGPLGLSGLGYNFGTGTGSIYEIDQAGAIADNGIWATNFQNIASEFTMIEWGDEQAVSNYGRMFCWLMNRQIPWGMGLARQSTSADVRYHIPGTTNDILNTVGSGWGSGAGVASGKRSRALASNSGTPYIQTYLDGVSQGINDMTAWGVLDLPVSLQASPNRRGSIVVGDFRVDTPENSWLGTVLCGAFFTQALSDAEILSVTQNPWQLFADGIFRVNGAGTAYPEDVVQSVSG